MRKIKVIAVTTITLGYMTLMFYFSSQNGSASRGLSKGIVRNIKDLSPALTDFKNDSLGRYMHFDFLLRKTVHFSEYFILALLVFTTLRIYGLNIKKSGIITIVGCFLYSVSDEIHQIFIKGRTATVFDIFIDTSGSVVAMLFVKFWFNRRSRLTKKS